MKQNDTPHQTTVLPRWVRFYPFLLIGGGFVGLYAALMLSIDKIKILENPDFQPVCNLNPILSCTSIMNSPHGATLSVPNPYLGLAAFGVIVTVGMAMLAGATFKKWFWQGLQLGTLAGLAFVHWLYVQSVYGIGKLCLYCMSVWVVVIPIFWYTTLMNYRQGNLPTHHRMRKVMTFATRHHGDILITWYLFLAVLIINRFWYFIAR